MMASSADFIRGELFASPTRRVRRIKPRNPGEYVSAASYRLDGIRSISTFSLKNDPGIDRC
jgi:hypothetical protein